MPIKFLNQLFISNVLNFPLKWQTFSGTQTKSQSLLYLWQLYGTRFGMVISIAVSWVDLYFVLNVILLIAFFCNSLLQTHSRSIFATYLHRIYGGISTVVCNMDIYANNRLYRAI
jgi:hypothetical protein